MTRASSSKRVPRAVREQQMLDAAAAVFSRHGYHTATVDEIADAAGISKPMVYLYFGSKEELFVAVVEREAARLRDMIGAAAAIGLTPYEQLRRGLEAFLTFVAEHRDGWTVLYRRARAQGEPLASGINKIRADTVLVVAALLERAVTESGAELPPQQDLVAIGHAVVGGCEALADWMLDQDEIAPRAMARRAVDLSWLGLSGLFQIPADEARSTP
ncbi:MAG: TetR/AcrR family transcriptional regulator [Micromonosporaceae bacterium]